MTENDPWGEIDRNALRVYARFPRTFYGEPFLTVDPAGAPILVVEEESGCPEVRHVSTEFAAAWTTEFQQDGCDAR